MIPNQFAPLAIRLGLDNRDVIGAAAIQQLVADGVAEDDCIDFKKAMYANVDQAKDELAKDIAAFANHRGGVLVVGVDESNGRAVRLSPFQGGDDTKRRVLSIHATRVRPLVPDLRVEWLPSGPGAPDGYLLIGVLASPLAPHSAGDPNQSSLRFPVRTGSQSRYMSEAEVAAKYAQRISTMASSSARAETLGEEGVHRLERDEPWIHLTLVPHAPGSMTIGANTRHVVREWIARRDLTSVWGQRYMEQPNIEIGHRRVTVGLWAPQARSVSLYYGDLHTDGAAFVARQVGQDERTHVPGTDQPAHFIALQSLVNAIALALRFAAAHSLENTGTSGTAEIRAGVLPATGDHARPIVIGSWERRRVASVSRGVQTVPSIAHVVSLEAIALDGGEWMRATKVIADEVVQCFGLEEVPQVTGYGELRTGWWGLSEEELERFAEKYGIPMARAEG